MITLTIVKEVRNGKIISYNKSMKLYKSMDKAKKDIIPIVKEMKLASSQKREPTIRISGVSYETKSEKTLLLELEAITLENDSDFNY